MNRIEEGNRGHIMDHRHEQPGKGLRGRARMAVFGTTAAFAGVSLLARAYGYTRLSLFLLGIGISLSLGYGLGVLRRKSDLSGPNASD